MNTDLPQPAAVERNKRAATVTKARTTSTSPEKLSSKLQLELHPTFVGVDL